MYVSNIDRFITVCLGPIVFGPPGENLFLLSKTPGKGEIVKAPHCTNQKSYSACVVGACFTLDYYSIKGSNSSILRLHSSFIVVFVNVA